MSFSSAARTNLTSKNVTIHENDVLGVGQFRVAVSGTYQGGNRNNQEAACKRFKPQYYVLETEFFSQDFRIADKAIQIAEDWNKMCEYGKEILVTKGNIHTSHNGTQYLVEPLIRYFTRYTSNNGWIASKDQEGWAVLAMEAFSHYTYHRSGGSLIVCDLQGRYRYDRFDRSRCRFELTDPAICSRRRLYGPTDLGEKGIESFFSNHVCNKFCNINGNWQTPNYTKCWFAMSSSTTMVASSDAYRLNTCDKARFTSTLQPIYDYDSDSDDSW